MSDLAREPGSVVGPYEVLEEIGRGGLGIVYRARHVHLGRITALKVLHDVWTSNPEFVERFQEEGRMMALLEHPNILRVYDAGRSSDTFFLAMSYLDGQTLESLMRNPIPVDYTLDVVRQVARALAFAHSRGVIHRDVKPANVMVGPGGEATLMDFGVARLMDSPETTMPGTRVGTPFYMAPEQITGSRVDHRVDLYALGVIFHQILSGRLPFPGPTTEEVFEGHVNHPPPPLPETCPEWMRSIVDKLLAKRAVDRFAGADALLAALESRSVGDFRAPTPASTPQPTLFRGGDTVGPSRIYRTALSLDVVGSSRMKHPGLTLVIEQQFTLFRDYVRAHLESFSCVDRIWSGDGLLALFARPNQGATCAAAILDGLAAFNASLGPGRSPIRVRIGVHNGPVMMRDGQPLGEIVSRTLDTAGHLQKTCPENSALMSESTYFGLPDGRCWHPTRPDARSPFPFAVYAWNSLAGHAGYVPDGGSSEGGQGERSDRVALELQTGSYRWSCIIDGDALIGRTDPGASRQPEIEIGRDDAVSRRHARVTRENHHGAFGFYLEDLDSANGTSLNGRWLQPHTPTLLQAGDVVEVGEVTIIRVMAVPSEERPELSLAASKRS